MKHIPAPLILAAGLSAATLAGATLGLAAIGPTAATASPRPQHTVLMRQSKVIPLDNAAAQHCNPASSAYTLVNQIKTVQVQYSFSQPDTRRHFLVTPTRDAPVSGCLQAQGGPWVIDARTSRGKLMATTELIPGRPAVRCLRANHHNSKWIFISTLA